MLALGIGPGDEVIVPESTWVATAAPLAYVGAIPVFADIDPDTWCIVADSVEQRVTPQTKAILTVDLYGGSARHGRDRCDRRGDGLPIIEDAAQAIGSSWHGRKAGTLGDVADVQLPRHEDADDGRGRDAGHRPRPTCSSGSPRCATTVAPPSDFKYFVTNELAYKYRMSSLQAAFGRAQLARLDELLERKRADLRLVRGAAAPTCPGCA